MLMLMSMLMSMLVSISKTHATSKEPSHVRSLLSHDKVPVVKAACVTAAAQHRARERISDNSSSSNNRLLKI